MADAREQWFCDGFEISNGMNLEVESYEGLFSGATLLSTDLSIPLRDGNLPGTTRLSPGGFNLNLWLGGDTRAEVEALWEQLMIVLMKRHSLVRWERRRPDGTSRECYGRTVGRISPTPIGRRGMRAQVEVEIPSGTWQNSGGPSNTGVLPLLSAGPLIPADWFDPDRSRTLLQSELPETDPSGGALVSYSGGGATYSNGWDFGATSHRFTRAGTPGTGPLNRIVELPGFNGSSAPMSDLAIQVTGPVTDLRIMCPETRSWATYDGTVPAGETLVIDGGKDVVHGPDVSKFRYRGPYMVEVMPQDNPLWDPHLQVTASSAAAGSSIQVVGRRKYHTM